MMKKRNRLEDIESQKNVSNTNLPLSDTGEEQVFDSSHHSNTSFHTSPVLCEYIAGCYIRKLRGDNVEFMNCLKEATKQCQVYNFYERYPDWEFMGIGSKL